MYANFGAVKDLVDQYQSKQKSTAKVETIADMKARAIWFHKDNCLSLLFRRLSLRPIVNFARCPAL